MKSLVLLIITQCLFLLLSCSSNTTDKNPIIRNAQTFDLNDFQEIKELVSENLDLDTLDIVPLDIEVLDNYLISRNKADEKLFTVINLAKKEIVANHINVGQGPEDMLYPSFVGYDNDYIYICDQQTSRINIYKKNDMLNNDNLNSIKQISFDKPIINRVRLLNNGFIGSVYQPFMKYIFNNEGITIDSIPYPIIDKELTEMENFDTFQNDACSDGNKKIAITYFSTDVIDFYNQNGILLKRLHGPDQFISRVKEVTYKNGAISSQYVGAIYDAYANPRNINNELWVLYSGKNSEEAHYEYSNNYIFTFSWEGKPLMAYHLNIGITSYAVDTNKRIIYAVTEQPDTHLITFVY